MLHIILNQIGKFANMRKDDFVAKYAPDKSFRVRFCPRRKAVSFCNPASLSFFLVTIIQNVIRRKKRCLPLPE